MTDGVYRKRLWEIASSAAKAKEAEELVKQRERDREVRNLILDMVQKACEKAANDGKFETWIPLGDSQVTVAQKMVKEDPTLLQLDAELLQGGDYFSFHLQWC